MKCDLFKPSSECRACTEKQCAVNGGDTAPSEMCGCDCCDNWHLVGDRGECTASKHE